VSHALEEFRTPGQFLQYLIDARGWTQRTLAIVLSVDETGLNKIIAGKQPLNATMALSLSQIFGIPPYDFLELQAKFDLAMAQVTARLDPRLATRAAIYGDLPVTDMIKRGWLRGVNDVRDPDVDAGLCHFFGVHSVDEIEILPHAAKKTNVHGNATPAQLAWLYRVKQMALDLPAAKFSEAALRGAVPKLKTLLVSPEATRKVPSMMMEAGVRYVIVESLPSAKIDGVCFWLNDKTPVIGMSLRYDRIDNFWFVLRHEIEHVLQGHGKDSAMLDIELEKDRAGTGKNVSAEERVANEAAAEFCVPRKKLENFIARKAPIFSERDIRGFAANLKIHPGIIAGQLQHETDRYDLFRNHLVKIRSIVTPNAYVDGWGDVAPVES
jgi:HTH-type transcriptional regulator / antitoxin HigA